jgi:hypothetical protein
MTDELGWTRTPDVFVRDVEDDVGLLGRVCGVVKRREREDRSGVLLGSRNRMNRMINTLDCLLELMGRRGRWPAR